MHIHNLIAISHQQRCERSDSIAFHELALPQDSSSRPYTNSLFTGFAIDMEGIMNLCDRPFSGHPVSEFREQKHEPDTQPPYQSNNDISGIASDRDPHRECTCIRAYPQPEDLPSLKYFESLYTSTRRPQCQDTFNPNGNAISRSRTSSITLIGLDVNEGPLNGEVPSRSTESPIIDAGKTQSSTSGQLPPSQYGNVDINGSPSRGNPHPHQMTDINVDQSPFNGKSQPTSPSFIMPNHITDKWSTYMKGVGEVANEIETLRQERIAVTTDWEQMVPNERWSSAKLRRGVSNRLQAVQRRERRLCVRLGRLQWVGDKVATWLGSVMLFLFHPDFSDAEILQRQLRIVFPRLEDLCLVDGGWSRGFMLAGTVGSLAQKPRSNGMSARRVSMSVMSLYRLYDMQQKDLACSNEAALLSVS